MFRELKEQDLAAVTKVALRLQQAETLDELAGILLQASVDLIDCEHAAYTELDPYFDRIGLQYSDQDFATSFRQLMDCWMSLMPTHPLLLHYQQRPFDRPLQLSDVTPMRHFYGSALYHDICAPLDTDHQIVLFLGNDPTAKGSQGAMPLSLGISINRKRTDFSEREAQLLQLLQAVCRPIFRAKRADHYVKLIESAQLTPAMQRCLMGFGLSERQAEVCFWMLQGKSNSEIGIILDVSAQTIRQHSIHIFEGLGVSGRMAMQRSVILGILREG